MGEGDEDVGEDDGGVGVDRRHTMMAPAVFRRHRVRGGESPPSSYSSLTSFLHGRRVSPLVLGSHGVGGARAPPRLDLSLYLFVSLYFCIPDSALSPLFTFPEIRNSDWGESFAQIFLIKLAFLQKKKGINRLMDGPRECQACPLSLGHLGHHFALILPPENSKYSKIILRPFLSRLDSV